MNVRTSKDFGQVLAFLIPGFIAMWGLSYLSPLAASWLSPTAGGPSIAGFLYVLLASLAVGLTINALRWAVMDPLYCKTGVRKPQLDYSNLKDHMAEYQASLETHYRYYQCYANTLLAIILAYAMQQAQLREAPWASVRCLIVLVAVVILYLAARDALKRHYARAAALLGTKE